MDSLDLSQSVSNTGVSIRSPARRLRIHRLANAFEEVFLGTPGDTWLHHTLQPFQHDVGTREAIGDLRGERGIEKGKQPRQSRTGGAPYPCMIVLPLVGKVRIPVKPITDSGVKPISQSGQAGHLSERSDAGVRLCRLLIGLGQ